MPIAKNGCGRFSDPGRAEGTWTYLDKLDFKWAASCTFLLPGPQPCFLPPASCFLPLLPACAFPAGWVFSSSPALVAQVVTNTIQLLPFRWESLIDLSPHFWAADISNSHLSPIHPRPRFRGQPHTACSGPSFRLISPRYEW